MKKGGTYWLFFGWWLEPTILMFKLFFWMAATICSSIASLFAIIGGILSGVKAKKKNTIYKGTNTNSENIYNGLYDDLYDELHGEIEEEMYDKYIAEQRRNIQNKQNKRKEEKIMYDRKKGIFPPGAYVVGEDIETGSYLLTVQDGEREGQVSYYENYSSYRKEELNKFQDFKKEYHLSLREKGMVIEVEGADIKKI